MSKKDGPVRRRAAYKDLTWVLPKEVDLKSPNSVDSLQRTQLHLYASSADHKDTVLALLHAVSSPPSPLSLSFYLLPPESDQYSQFLSGYDAQSQRQAPMDPIACSLLFWK